MKYTKNWTRNDFIKFRKLKRRGYTDDELLEHFGDVLYEEAEIFNRNCNIIPVDIIWSKLINNNQLHKDKSYYTYSKSVSKSFDYEYDYLIRLITNNKKVYLINLTFDKINGIETFYITFNTSKQFDIHYETLHDKTIKKCKVEILNMILCDDKFLKELGSVVRNISYTLSEFSKDMNIKHFSIKETNDEKMLNLYKNIIYQSFDNVIECYVNSKEFKGYIFNI